MRRRPPKPQPQALPATVAPGFWVSFRQRKVVQWTLAYAAGATALLQLVVLVSEQFAWPPLVGRSAIVALACGLPVAIVIAWYHGEKGQQRISGGELLWLAIFLSLMAALLWRLQSEVPPASEARESRARATAPAAEPKRRIAVLPLVNLSPDPENGYFAEGLHDELLDALGRLGSLEVISRTTMRSFRDSTLPTREIAGELQASHVLEGSVRREGNRLRMSLRLVDPRADRQLWSESYSGEVGDALSLQAEIAVDVARKLGDRVSPSSGGLAGIHPDAVEFYLQSRTLQDNTAGTLRQRRELLDAALSLAPEFGLARAERADTLAMLHFFAGLPRGEVEALARQDLAAARRLAADQPATHLAEVKVRYYVDRDYAGALALADAALLRWPTASALLAVRGYLCNRLGRHDDAFESLEQATRLDPLNANYIQQLQIASTETRRDYLASWRLARRAYGLEPTASKRDAVAFVEFVLSGDVQAYVGDLARVAGMYRAEGDEVTALRMELRAAELLGDWAGASDMLSRSRLDALPMPNTGGNRLPSSLLQLYYLTRMGREAEAVRQYRSALDSLTRQLPDSASPVWLHAWIAQAHALAGNEPEARKALVLAAAEADRPVDPIINTNARGAIARALGLLGDDKACVELLRRLLAEPNGAHAAFVLNDSMVTWKLGRSPDFARLRKELLAQVQSGNERFVLMKAQAQSPETLVR